MLDENYIPLRLSLCLFSNLFLQRHLLQSNYCCCCYCIANKNNIVYFVLFSKRRFENVFFFVTFIYIRVIRAKTFSGEININR